MGNPKDNVRRPITLVSRTGTAGHLEAVVTTTTRLQFDGSSTELGPFYVAA